MGENFATQFQKLR